MKLNEAIEEYLFTRSVKLSAKSIKVYGYNLRAFERFIGKDKPLEKITSRDVAAFLSEQAQRLIESTLCNYASTLRLFFRFWADRGMSTVEAKWIEGPKIPEKVPNFITPEHFDLIDEYHDDDEFNELMRKLIFNLLWETGMRVGELVSLNIADIDTQNRCGYVLTEKSKRLRVLVWSPKTNDLMIKYLGVRLCLNSRPELFQTPYVRGRRTRLTTRSIQRWCRSLEDELGFPINPHAFRHGKMHMVVNMGGNRHHVQNIAGHSSIEASEVYTRLNVEEQYRLQEKFLPQAA